MNPTPTIEVDLSSPWLAVAVGGFVLLVLLVALIARRVPRPAASTDAKLDALDRRLGAAEDKLKKADHDLNNIRTVVNNLPTKDSITSISVKLAESHGKMEGMSATLHTVTKGIDRIEDFLMKAASDAIMGAKASKVSNGDHE